MSALKTRVWVCIESLPHTTHRHTAARISATHVVCLRLLTAVIVLPLSGFMVCLGSHIDLATLALVIDQMYWWHALILWQFTKTEPSSLHELC